MLPRPSNRRLIKQDFRYQAETDTYRCPAGEQLTRRFSSVENGMTLHTYWADACAGCTVKGQCTTGKERRIKRWEHEHVVEAMQARLDRMPDAMRVRRRTVEHVFGTLKDWMGRSHFKMQTLERVGTEMSLHVLAYNLNRAIALLGTQGLIAPARLHHVADQPTRVFHKASVELGPSAECLKRLSKADMAAARLAATI